MIKIDVPELEEIEQRLGEFKKKAPVVLSRSMNESFRNVRKNISIESRKRYAVKAGDLKNSIKYHYKKASKNNLDSSATITGKRLALSKFKVVSRPTAKGKKSPTINRAKVLKSNSPKVILNTIAASVRAKNGKEHTGLFVRGGKFNRPKKGRYKDSKARRENLKQLVGPAVPQMLRNKKVIEAIQGEGNQKLQERLNHYIKRALEGR